MPLLCCGAKPASKITACSHGGLIGSRSPGRSTRVPAAAEQHRVQRCRYTILLRQSPRGRCWLPAEHEMGSCIQVRLQYCRLFVPFWRLPASCCDEKRVCKTCEPCNEGIASAARSKKAARPCHSVCRSGAKDLPRRPCTIMREIHQLLSG